MVVLVYVVVLDLLLGLVESFVQEIPHVVVPVVQAQVQLVAADQSVESEEEWLDQGLSAFKEEIEGEDPEEVSDVVGSCEVVEVSVVCDVHQSS